MKIKKCGELTVYHRFLLHFVEYYEQSTFELVY
jgi:hypothetical protein